MVEETNILNPILAEVGEFGTYQRRVCFLFFTAATIVIFHSFIYVFEAKQVNHRCKIPECDVLPTEFKPSWWENAIPSQNSEPSKCTKYKRVNISNNQSCTLTDFDREIEEKCDQFVYETNEISILHDYNLQCDENLWKLTLVGTINNCGALIGFPIAGMLSDRIGRKTMLVVGMVLSGVIGIVRSFVNTYILFLILEFLETLCVTGSHGIIWILALETVGQKKGVLIIVLLNLFFTFGIVLEGFIAWVLQSWRPLLQIFYSFHFIFILYYWLLPESILWLLAKNRVSEVKDILENIARVNGKVLSEENLKILKNYKTNKKNIKSNSISKLFSSTVLVLRLVICALCMGFINFLYIGLSINAVALSENSYLDYILSMLIEAPAIMIYLLVDKVGRRPLLSTSFGLTGLLCIGFIFIPKGTYWLRLTVYLLEKLIVSMSISAFLTYISELFPTPFRNFLLSICSMFGTIGSIASAQIPLLKMIWEPLPSVLYGCSGILGALLILILPETTNKQLPNTIQEAENIGKLIVAVD